MSTEPHRRRLPHRSSSRAHPQLVGKVSADEVAVLLVLLRRLLRSLPLTYDSERRRRVDVGNGARSVVTEPAGCVAPTLGLHTDPLAQDGNEDAGLLVAVAWQ